MHSATVAYECKGLAHLKAPFSLCAKLCTWFLYFEAEPFDTLTAEAWARNEAWNRYERPTIRSQSVSDANSEWKKISHHGALTCFSLRRRDCRQLSRTLFALTELCGHISFHYLCNSMKKKTRQTNVKAWKTWNMRPCGLLSSNLATV